MTEALVGARPLARPLFEPAAGLVVVSAATSQLGATIAFHAFGRIGPVGTAGGRLAFATLFLALVTGLPRRRSRRDWLPVIPLGLALGTTNSLFYLAFERLPLGAAVTVEFLGPIAVAVIGSRSAQHLAAAVLAAGGIALLSEGLGSSNAAGLAFALGAGIAWAVYILAARRVAAVWPGTSGLTPSVAIAAVVVAPFALAQGGSGFLEPKALAACAGVGLLGSALPYALDQVALRRVSARAFSVLLSLHPAIGALLGFAVLGQRIGVQTGIAIALVVSASAMAARADPPRTEPLPEPA